ncbi:thymidylate kinase [Acidocella aquatica]|uniref:Thymidylate kinase n=1 Tax=Acidocella aquatica TaxID=1922313 RepID=A0ABQ6A852_9PROT|nr:dTMP kinase [Acidocella aquatica]GLR66260.1 thymidylate kinase [Acidocella aquatica]
MSVRDGVFITLEGGEGAGKSTAALRLTTLLREAGHEVLATREPGGTPGAEAIRALLLNPDTELTAMAQTMLHFAARADHVACVIRPALARGAVVICDRYSDSTMAYQAYGMGVEIAAVAALTRLIDLMPDITFMLEVPESVSKSRLNSRGAASDRYEQMGAEVMARIAQGFRAIAAAEPARCVVVDGTEPVEVVVGRMREVIRERTGR